MQFLAKLLELNHAPLGMEVGKDDHSVQILTFQSILRKKNVFIDLHPAP